MMKIVYWPYNFKVLILLTGFSFGFYRRIQANTDKRDNFLADHDGQQVLLKYEQQTTIESIANASELNKTHDTLENLADARNPIFIFMCVVYILLILSAITSNLVVILLYKLGLTNKTELSSFLVNLAIADFIMASVCMPFTFAQAILHEWIFGAFMCPVVLFAQVLTVSVSVYTLVAIGIDRQVKTWQTKYARK
jgi:hypothetical protein